MARSKKGRKATVVPVMEAEKPSPTTSNVRCAKCFKFAVIINHPWDWDDELETMTCDECQTVTAGRAFRFVTSRGRVFTIVFDPSQYREMLGHLE